MHRRVIGEEHKHLLAEEYIGSHEYHRPNTGKDPCPMDGLYGPLWLACGNILEPETKPENVFAMQDELNKMVKEFSGGMKRRVEIARAVLSCGKNIFMDEPFNGLDPETKRKTAEFIKKYQNGRTIVFASHFTEDAELMNGEEVKLWKDV